MAYRVLRAQDVTADLARIHDHLVDSYCGLGDGLPEALDRADARIRKIENAMTRLGAMPHQGTLCEEVLPRLRRVTKDMAILYFVANEEHLEVRVLAVFFSGQDHLRHIVERLDTRRAHRPADLPDDPQAALDRSEAPAWTKRRRAEGGLSELQTGTQLRHARRPETGSVSQTKQPPAKTESERCPGFSWVRGAANCRVAAIVAA